MPSATPTAADQTWGPDPWCKFDYWRNPTRMGVSSDRPLGRNPVLFVRHGGGGVIGDYRHYRSTDYGDAFYFLQWILGRQPATEPSRHWDVVAFTSGQQQWATFFGEPIIIERSIASWASAAIRDCQRCIASLKHLAPSYGYDEDNVTLLGESYGAVLLALSQLAPPLLGSGGQFSWTEQSREPRTHTSRAKGLIFNIGQTDARVVDGQDWLTGGNYAGWFGTSPADDTDIANVPDDVRAMMSVASYFERGDLQYYPGFYNVSREDGDHIRPYSNPHDSAQWAALNATALAAGITMPGLFYVPGDLTNTQWPNGPNHTALLRYQALEGFLAERLLNG